MIESGILAATALLLLGAAWWDIRQHRIPNLMPALLLVFYAVYSVAAGATTLPWWNIAHFALALGAAIFLFNLGRIGGGNAKLYTAAALWFPLQQAHMLLLTTALFAALLIITYALERHFTRRPDGKENPAHRIPYGLAIAAGTITCWLLRTA